MIIQNTKPPVWDKLHAVFDIDDTQTVYTYGDVLHNPANLPIDDHLYEHESVHARQQTMYQGGPEAWWQRYVVDVDFRLEQEVEAYGAQWRSYCKTTKDREKRVKYLWILATHLSGPTYKIGINIFTAYGKIRKLGELR